MPSTIPISVAEEGYLAALREEMAVMIPSGTCNCVNCLAPEHIKRLMVIIDRLKSEIQRLEEENAGN